MRGVIHRDTAGPDPVGLADRHELLQLPGRPETTTDAGPFTAANDNAPAHRSNRASTCSFDNPTATMPPPPANPARARLRNATTFAASANDNPPATNAAAISPCECPTTAAGTTPAARHTCANDTITANNAGCTTSTRSNPGAPATPRNTPANDQSTNGANARSHSAIQNANTGEASNNSTPIPAHCEP
ncbi:hypothetical protein GCM10027610_025940 [Dactylosporangium cerinum]